MNPEHKHWRLEQGADGIAWLHLNKAGPGPNVLSTEVLAELGRIVEGLAGRSPRGLILISDKPSGFIAGADVREIAAVGDTGSALDLVRAGHVVFDRLEALDCPTVAAIRGFCLGGGLELALACRYRVAVDEPATRLGLPEVLLGIHPGFGGTMRSIRLIGAPAAMDLMLSGRTVDARSAERLGIIDRAVPERHFLSAAVAHVDAGPKRRRLGSLPRLASLGPVRPWLARYLRARVAKRARPEHYPAPYALIDLWQRHGGDPRHMLEAEQQSVARLATSPSARNLVRVFFLQERLKSLGRASADPLKRVHVIGAGVMGGDIAAWCALRGLTVTLQDRAPRYIAPALKRAGELYSKRVRDRRQRQGVCDRLIPDHTGRGIAEADVVIEAIIEDLTAKQALYAQIEPQLKPGALLATNTSSIPLEQLAEGLRQPERLVGVHFFNPVAKMQLVEVIGCPATGLDRLAQAAAFVRSIDRLPLPVRSSPGFLVNRVLLPYMNEAVKVLVEGTAPERIDAAATGFGMPMGPIELCDTVGLDVCLSVGEILGRHFGSEVPERFREMVAQGKLGRKVGRGFYEYRKGVPVKQKLAATDAAGLDELGDRLILRMVNEAMACLREGVVEDADLLDAGLVFGTGFAPFRGGPLHYVKERGKTETQARLAALERQLGPRYAADPGWESLAI